MKEDLTLNIGTKYNGDGFKKIDQSLKSTAKTVNSASKAIGTISNELGQMGGAAGKAANAVSGLFQSFMAGGPIAAVVAGITAAVSFLVKAFNDAKERAKETAETMRNSFKGAFEKSSEAAKDFLDKLSSMKSTEKIVQQGIDFVNDVESRSKSADIKQNAYIERSATVDDLQKQKASAKERRDLALQQLDTKSTTASTNAVKAAKARDIASAELEVKAGEIVAFEQTMKDMDSLLDKKLLDQFHSLEDAVSKATSDVISNGREATAFMAQKNHVTSSGTTYTTEYAVSYGEVLEDAAQELNKFKKEHEEVIKDLEAYKEAAQKHKELKAQLTKLTHAYQEAEQAAAQAAVLAGGVVPKENAVEKLRIEEQYQKEIAALEEQEKAIKNAAKQYADSMDDIIKAQEEKMKEVPAASENLAKEIEKTEAELKKLKDAQSEAFTKFKEAAAKAVEAVNDPTAKKTDKDEAKNAASDAQKKLNQLDKPIQDAKKKLADLNTKKFKEQQQKLVDEQRKLMEQDKQTAVQKLEAHKKEQQAAKELAEAERKAADVIAQWKENPQQAIGKWRKEQNQIQREDEKEQKQQNKNAGQAKNEADKLAKKLFNKDGELRRGANAFDIGRFAEASDYLGFNNVSDDQLLAMQTKRDNLRSKLFNDDGTLKRGVSEIGQDMTTFKKLDKALKNVDAVKDAEKKRAENEDKRTQSLSNIQQELKKLAEKAGI